MRHKQLSFDLMEQYLGSDAGMPPLSRDSDDDLEYRRMVRVIQRAVDGELTDRQRECVRLYYYEGRKMAEVAVILGIQTPAVSRHLKKARSRLENVLCYLFDRLAE